ncbi:hypothetical protein BN1708_009645, partial [Verticillium longisporum]
MGFAQCGWPIWQVDDVSLCFQQDFLKSLFPFITIAVSFLVLLFPYAWRAASHISLRKRGYEPLANAADDHANTAANHTDLPPDELEDSDDNDEPLTMNRNGGGRLSLIKTTTRGSVISIVQADSPHAQKLSVFVEEAAIIGLVAIYIIAIVTGGYGEKGKLSAVAGLVAWLYVFAIATLRLTLTSTQWRVPATLWNHTASIYGCQWLFTTFIFRSVLIHPSSRLIQILVIVEFALTTFLFVMAISTRKGNKTVLLEWEDGVEPSREPLASLLSLATFSWIDPMIWRGYKETIEMKAVWNLVPQEKAAAVLADYRTLKRTTSLAMHLLKYFKGELIFQCFLAFIGGVFTFAPTLLLKAILEYVERPDEAPINVLWLYVLLLPILDLVRSFGDGMALWIGRKICIRIRAIIVGEIYAKALRRKAAAGAEKVLGEKKDQADAGKEGTMDKIKRKLRLKKKKSQDSASDAEASAAGAPKEAKTDDEQANLGTIINLMSVDSFKIAEITAYLHFLCASAPTQLVISVVLLWQVMGLSAIPGLVVMALLLPVNYGFARGFTNTSKQILKATDKRINVTNEILNNIRIIKYFAWEQRFGRIVDEKRAAELQALRSRFVIWSCAVAVWNSVPVLITFFSFLIYTAVEKKPLYPSVAFTAISLFMLLRVPLDQFGDMFAHVQETKNMNSVERIKEYLDVEQEAEPIIEKNRPAANWPSQGSIEFIGYTTAYRKELDPVLRNLSFKINPKEKVGIVGRTGAGKSSLALAIFRALEADAGKILIDDVDIGLIGLRDLREAITIVPQDPTLFQGTIRTNLDPFDMYADEQIFEALRKVQLIGPSESLTRPQTPAASSLNPGTPTISVSSDGAPARSPTASIAPANKNVFLDLSSPVSESGSNLSQGQRQLLCLARAILKNPTVLVMDEATASIDYATDSKIQETIRELTSTIITIAHRLQTIVDYDKVLVLDKGSVVEYGHPYELIRKDKGSFRSMCDMSGELDLLIKAAKKKWDSGRLVDVDEEEQ